MTIAVLPPHVIVKARDSNTHEWRGQIAEGRPWLEEQLQIAALWTNRTGKREGPGMFGALKQFYKTRKAFEMMVEHEETHSFRYSHLLRVRIDASGNLDDGWLARNLARINGREDAALLWADFAWLAGRAAGERLSRVWSNILRVIRRCNSSPSRKLREFNAECRTLE